MSVHQGGKICLLSPYDAEQLERHGVLPKCSEHRHCRIADAEQLRANGLLRRHETEWHFRRARHGHVANGLLRPFQ
jgi:hypothetical protein